MRSRPCRPELGIALRAGRSDRRRGASHGHVITEAQPPPPRAALTRALPKSPPPAVPPPLGADRDWSRCNA